MGSSRLEVLFVCGSNSCRSQMAEGLLREIGGDRIEVKSAGMESSAVHPRAVQVMRERGIDIAAQRSKSVAELGPGGFDLVVTLCDPAREYCLSPASATPAPVVEPDVPVEKTPIFRGDPFHLHWSLDDPAAAEGSEEEILAVFRAVRDEIESRVNVLLEQGYAETFLAQRMRLDELLDSIEEGIVVHDRSRRIFLFNQAAERITGRSRDEVLGRDCHQVFAPDGLCGSRCPFDLGPTEPPERREYTARITTVEGGEKRLRMRAIAVELGSAATRGVLLSMRDVTEVSDLRSKLRERPSFRGMIGVARRMQEVFQTIREVAPSNYSVLINGESGTGKELVARALHDESHREQGSFVPVNCGALPENILESELFGHVRGAFTGAIRDKKGRFELADGGTLFLDEIGELSQALQVKLLRVLQEKSFERVGGEKTISVDVRIVSATNRDLREMVREGVFREDLYYRLCVVPIQLPPLRERPEDMSFLVEHILQTIREESGKPIRGVSPTALEHLRGYPWSGNVRELINALQFASIRCNEEQIQIEHLPPEVVGFSGDPDLAADTGRARAGGPVAAGNAFPTGVGRRRKLDVASVRQALVETAGNKVQAARLLGVGRATLYRFLKDNPLE